MIPWSHFSQLLRLMSATAKQITSLLSYAHDATSKPHSISARCRSCQPSDPVMRSAILLAQAPSHNKPRCHAELDDPAGIRSNLKVRRTVCNLSGTLCLHPEFPLQISQIYIDRVVSLAQNMILLVAMVPAEFGRDFSRTSGDAEFCFMQKRRWAFSRRFRIIEL